MQKSDIKGDLALTKALMVCGAITGPLFFAVAIIQVITRPGYDIRQNAISQLSLGDLGWIQITSFIVTGLLAMACAIGVRRMLKGQRGGTWGALLIGTFGLGLIVAGIFPPDPAFGFPPGAPAGPAMPMSGHAMLHAVGFFISILSMIIDSFVFTLRFRALGQRRWVVYCAASGMAVPILIVMSGAMMSWAGLIVAFAGAAAFGWISVLAVRLMAELGEIEAGSYS